MAPFNIILKNAIPALKNAVKATGNIVATSGKTVIINAPNKAAAIKAFQKATGAAKTTIQSVSKVSLKSR